MTRILILTLAILAGAVLAKAAAAQPTCMPHDELVPQLIEMHGERLAYSGLTSKQNILEIWVNPSTGAWTAVILNAADMACVASQGEFWQDWTAEPAGVPG